MYNELNIKCDITIESNNLLLNKIDYINELSLFMEDGNENIIMKTIRAIVDGIKKIIKWIREQLFDRDAIECAKFINKYGSKLSNYYIPTNLDFDIAIKRINDSYNIIRNNYKTATDSKYIDDILNYYKNEPMSMRYKIPCNKMPVLFTKLNDIIAKFEKLSDDMEKECQKQVNKGMDISAIKSGLKIVNSSMFIFKQIGRMINPSIIVKDSYFHRELAKSIAKGLIKDSDISDKMLKLMNLTREKFDNIISRELPNR